MSEAAKTWRKFCTWYGADTVERKFGLKAPDEWRDAIDAVPKDALPAVLSRIRGEFPSFMPSLLEFERVAREAQKPVAPDKGPTVAERLKDYVLRNYDITPNQLRQPWEFIGREFDAPGPDGKMRYHHGVEITGVVVPADPERERIAVRVMVADMQLDRVA